jgi:signal transduction histidine kinase
MQQERVAAGGSVVGGSRVGGASGCVAEIHWLLDQVSQEDTVAGVCEVLVAGVVHLLHAGTATVHVGFAEPGALALQAWHTVDARLPVPRGRLDAESPDAAARAVVERRAQFLSARDMDGSGVTFALPASACAFVAPLIAGGEVQGVVSMVFTRPVSPAEREAIASIAAPAAAFLQRARLLAERLPAAAPREALLPEELHEILVRTEKLRALGEMAAGIAHDFKNILSPLSLYIQLLRRTFQRGGDDVPSHCEEALKEMAHVIERGVQTADRLRDFSRHLPDAPTERVEVDVLVNEAAELSRPRLACQARVRGVVLHKVFSAPPPVEARASEMVLALLNLINNAADAAGVGGSVTVSTGDGDGGSWVRVEDDGPGVPEALRERIFDPFFSTKGDAGTGLGLVMVQAFARRHGGRLTLEPSSGRGATFTLWLPSIAPPDGAGAPPPWARHA